MSQSYWSKIARFYDRLGNWNSLSNIYERRARQCAITQLDLRAGQSVLEVGVGNGLSQADLLAGVGERGLSAGVDLSPGMIRLSAAAHVDMVATQANAMSLPFASRTFDGLLSTYVLDLVPEPQITIVLAEFRRVLKPDGRMILASLAEGVGPISKIGAGLWKAAYAINPMWCGGCRPLQLVPYLEQAGFTVESTKAIVQMGLPSEVLRACL